MIRPALVLTFFLSIAGGAVAADPWDPFERQIALGRLAALLYAADAVLGEDEAADGDGAPAMYARLYRNALEMESLRARACGSGRIKGKVCQRRYAPAWLRPPGSFTPTLPQVWRWTDLLQREVLEVTGAICATAPPNPEGPGACSVE